MDKTPRQKYLTRLRQTLVTRFDDSELRTLCFDLGIDYADLPGEGRADKARELLAYLDRRDRILELLEVGQRIRSDVPWSQVYLDDRMDILRDKRDIADRARREMRERQRVVNLRPLDVTHTFKDRVHEMRELCKHLADGSVRFVSVVGRAGMGKTALVSRVLGDLEREVSTVAGEEKALPIDGILYLSARSTGLGLERVYADAGRMLGEPDASRLEACWADGSMPLTAKIEYLLETMQDGLYVILLDNLESTMAEDGTIIEDGLRLFIECCLTQPGGAHLIATSREQVKIAAALHGVRSIALREGLPEEDAIALLRDLDPQGTLGLRDASEDDLHRAARFTQGVPRALEILAGILHEDPSASLRELLADEKLFSERVVEQLVAEGYRRLRDDERRVMEALAVFDRPVEETSIAYLLHPWFPGLDVRTRLRRLARSHFVSINRITGECSLHPLDREYAYRQLSDDDAPGAHTRQNLELRAADFYANIRKPEIEWRSIEDLTPQLSEFEHLVRAGGYADAFQVLNPVDFDYLFLWGHCTRLVELQEKLLGRLTNPSSRLGNLDSLGRAYRSLGQFEKAIEFHEQALSIAREIGHRKMEGFQLSGLGLAYGSLGQLEPSIEYYEQALAIAREIGYRKEEGVQLGHLGYAYRSLGQIERAIEFLEDALAIDRDIRYRRGEGIHLGHLGLAYHALGHVERAIMLYEEALAITREIGYRRHVSGRLGSLGNAYFDLGQFEKAIEFHEQALSIAREIGHRVGQSYQLLGLSRALLATGELTKARHRCAEALAIVAAGIRYQEALTLGIILLHQGDSAAGEIFMDAVDRCRTILDLTAGLYRAHYVLAAGRAGQAICDPRWAQKSERADLLSPVLTEYRRALEITAAPGIVQDAIRDLKLIQAAGIEGLEPAFELLNSALE